MSCETSIAAMHGKGKSLINDQKLCLLLSQELFLTKLAVDPKEDLLKFIKYAVLAGRITRH